MTSARASMLHQRMREVIAAGGGLTTDEQHDLHALLGTLAGRPAPQAYRSPGSSRVAELAGAMAELVTAAAVLPLAEQHQLIRVMFARLAVLEQARGPRPLTVEGGHS